MKLFICLWMFIDLWFSPNLWASFMMFYIPNKQNDPISSESQLFCDIKRKTEVEIWNYNDEFYHCMQVVKEEKSK